MLGSAEELGFSLWVAWIWLEAAGWAHSCIPSFPPGVQGDSSGGSPRT